MHASSVRAVESAAATLFGAVTDSIRAASRIVQARSELQRTDYQEVAATVAKVRAAHPELLLTENYVNAWGYRLAGEKQFSAAIRLFQYNVATFPKSWNVWDSLAEGYEMSGDKQNAIDNYRHSLEINPGNTHGAEALKRLSAAH